MNKSLIESFSKLATKIKNDIINSSGKEQITNTYKMKAIKTVLDVLKKFTEEITSVDQLKNIIGIGPKTINRVQEILNTGKLSELDNFKNGAEQLDELEKVFGIGKKKAIELNKKYGVETLEDLEKLVLTGTDLPEAIVKGIKYAKLITTNIPREEIEDIHIYLQQRILKVDPKLHLTICGSFRRLRERCNDIDVVITHSKLKYNTDTKNSDFLYKFVSVLENENFIVDSFTGKDVLTKYMGICQFKKNPIRRIDIRFIPYISYYYAILYFTGSRNFNKKMRNFAISYGMTLNEYGLFDKNNKSHVVNSEKEIFDLLNMIYLAPDERE